MNQRRSSCQKLMCSDKWSLFRSWFGLVAMHTRQIKIIDGKFDSYLAPLCVCVNVSMCVPACVCVCVHLPFHLPFIHNWWATVCWTSFHSCDKIWTVFNFGLFWVVDTAYHPWHTGCLQGTLYSVSVSPVNKEISTLFNFSTVQCSQFWMISVKLNANVFNSIYGKNTLPIFEKYGFWLSTPCNITMLDRAYCCQHGKMAYTDFWPFLLPPPPFLVLQWTWPSVAVGEIHVYAAYPEMHAVHD